MLFTKPLPQVERDIARQQAVAQHRGERGRGRPAAAHRDAPVVDVTAFELVRKVAHSIAFRDDSLWSILRADVAKWTPRTVANAGLFLDNLLHERDTLASRANQDDAARTNIAFHLTAATRLALSPASTDVDESKGHLVHALLWSVHPRGPTWDKSTEAFVWRNADVQRAVARLGAAEATPHTMNAHKRSRSKAKCPSCGCTTCRCVRGKQCATCRCVRCRC